MPTLETLGTSRSEVRILPTQGRKSGQQRLQTQSDDRLMTWRYSTEWRKSAFIRPSLGANDVTPSRRRAYFGPQHGWREVDVIPRSVLTEPREGPCIVEEYDATCVVPPDARFALDSFGNIIIDLAKSSMMSERNAVDSVICAFAAGHSCIVRAKCRSHPA